MVDAVARPAPRPLESLASISSPRFSRPARRLNLPSPSRRSSSSRTRQHAKHTAPTPHHNGRNHHYQRSLTLRGRWDRQNRRHTARAQAGTRLLKPKEGAKTEQSRPANVRGRRDASSCASGVGVTFSGYRKPTTPGGMDTRSGSTRDLPRAAHASRSASGPPTDGSPGTVGSRTATPGQSPDESPKHTRGSRRTIPWQFAHHQGDACRGATRSGGRLTPRPPARRLKHPFRYASTGRRQHVAVVRCRSTGERIASSSSSARWAVPFGRHSVFRCLDRHSPGFVLLRFDPEPRGHLP